MPGGTRREAPRCDRTEDIITFTELADHGITLADVRRRCPLAVEYGSADSPYWLASELDGLLGPDAEEGWEP